MEGVVTREPVDIKVGVLLPESSAAADDLDETGHAPAVGRRGVDGESRGRRVAQLGHDVLHAAAEAIGREIGHVVSGVIAGIDAQPPATGSFAIDDVGLKFGVKATLGAGKAIEAFFTASGEATVEVTLTLRQPGSTR